MKNFQGDCTELHRANSQCNHNDYMKFAGCRVVDIAVDNLLEAIDNKKEKYSITAYIKNDDTIFDNDNNDLQ